MAIDILIFNHSLSNTGQLDGNLLYTHFAQVRSDDFRGSTNPNEHSSSTNSQ